MSIEIIVSEFQRRKSKKREAGEFQTPLSSSNLPKIKRADEVINEELS